MSYKPVVEEEDDTTIELQIPAEDASIIPSSLNKEGPEAENLLYVQNPPVSSAPLISSTNSGNTYSTFSTPPPPKLSLKETIVALLNQYKLTIGGTVLLAISLLLLGTLVWKDTFGFKAWVSIIITAITFLALVKSVWTPELLMMFNTGFLLLFEVIDASEALEGFSNSGVFTIAVMFVVAAGVQESGALEYAVKYLLRTPSNVFLALIRMMVPVAALSAFINNTPLVAMMIPILEDWCKKLKIPPSKVMMPLSYAAILGGTCSLIGTSTNLVVVGFLRNEDPSIHLPIFEMGKVGLPLAIVGIAYITIASKWLLPDRSSGAMQLLQVPRDYTVNAKVAPTSQLVGQTVHALRNLEGLFLVDIEREDGTVIPVVGSEVEIHSGDLLTFVGKVDGVRELRNIPGLLPTNQKEKPIQPNANRVLVEAVISSRSWLIGKTARECGFRARYGAAILSIHREGEHIRSKIGAVKFKHGDCLLLECKPSFVESHNDPSSDFIAVSEISGGRAVQGKFSYKMVVAPLISLSMIILNAAEVLPILTASLMAVFAMVLTRCISMKQLTRSVNIPVVVIVAGSFGMATALDKTGVADEISRNLIYLFEGTGSIGLLFSLYICTMLLTAMLSNASSVAVMFPIAWRITSVPLKARMYILMYAASADFATPIGYQTNLMVLGPGGYKFLDYTRFGLPLQILLCISSVLLTHAIYV